jgi:hypothetical protein
MIFPYKILCLDSIEKQVSENVHVEISINSGPEKRIFLILDLSDSCLFIHESLKKLGWLCSQIPFQWQVTIFALSGQEAIFPCSDILFSRDLENFLRQLDGSRQWDEWRTMQIHRGSFLQPTLDSIGEMFRAEKSIDPKSPESALVFLITDGELLDPDPVRLPEGVKVVGILCQKQEINRFNRIINYQKIPMMELGSIELNHFILNQINPGMELCEISANFHFEIKGYETKNFAGRKKPSWDFSKGPLIVEINKSYIGQSDAYIEFRTKDKAVTKITLDLISNYANQIDIKLKSATISSGVFFRVTDQNNVHQILADCRATASRNGHLSIQTITKLFEAIDVQAKLDNSLIIFVPKKSDEIKEQSLSLSSVRGNFNLLIGLLFRDSDFPFFMEANETVPKDPGFVPKKNVLIQFDSNIARWHMFFGENKTTFAPRGCRPLIGVFQNENGDECEAYYSGPMVLV